MISRWRGTVVVNVTGLIQENQTELTETHPALPVVSVGDFLELIAVVLVAHSTV